MKALGNKRKIKDPKPPKHNGQVSIYGTKPPEDAKPAGRPTALDPKLIDTICNYVTIGCNMDTACRAAGITSKTLSNWASIAKLDDTSSHAELFRRISIAIAEAEARDLSIIERAAMGSEAQYERDLDGKLVLNERGKPIVLRAEINPDVRSAMWRLERRFPNKWGPKAQLTLDDDREKPIDVTPVEPAKLASELLDLAETLSAISETKDEK